MIYCERRQSIVTRLASVNVHLVRSISTAWEGGDYSWVEWADPEVEFVIADGPEPGRSKGRAGLAPSLLDFQGAWEQYHSEAVEYRELDDERVLVLTYASARGKASGLEIGQERANLFHLRRGKVTKLVAYWDRKRALADVSAAAPGADWRRHVVTAPT
jgi:ketosteroid isomerase-like protein